MKISRLVSWTGPAYIGTIASSWLAAAAYVFLARPDLVLGSKLFTWLLIAAASTPVASALATTMLVLDFILLKFRVRTLPVGRTAWHMALIAPVPLAAAAAYLWPRLQGMPSTAALALAVAAPVAATALGVRLALGQKVTTQG